MRKIKILWFLLLGLCRVSCCLAQSGWAVPHLRELTQANTIERRSIQVSDVELSFLKHVTTEIINECVKYPGPGDPEDPEAMFRQFRIERVSLTPHGALGLVMQGSGGCKCGATGNCPFWIISEKPNPEVLLEADGIQTFAIQRNQTANYFDIVLGRHESAMMSDLQRFRFDGKKYRLNDCASIAKKPLVTPGRCSK